MRQKKVSGWKEKTLTKNSLLIKVTPDKTWCLVRCMYQILKTQLFDIQTGREKPQEGVFTISRYKNLQVWSEGAYDFFSRSLLSLPPSTLQSWSFSLILSSSSSLPYLSEATSKGNSTSLFYEYSVFFLAVFVPFSDWKYHRRLSDTTGADRITWRQRGFSGCLFFLLTFWRIVYRPEMDQTRINKLRIQVYVARHILFYSLYRVFSVDGMPISSSFGGEG